MSRIPSTMQAAVLTGHGGSDRLEIREEVTVATRGRCDVLIRVAAAAVNNTDINTREGWYSKSSHSGDQTGWNERPLRCGARLLSLLLLHRGEPGESRPG
jgi:hypothetical protein